MTTLGSERRSGRGTETITWQDDDFYLSLCDDVLGICRACSAGVLTVTPELYEALRQARQLLAIDAKGVDPVTQLMMRVAAANAASILDQFGPSSPPAGGAPSRAADR
ncbi:MAG TPA: hypothetical protein VLX59_13990 [Acidimicrobiales bacterium]|nr:hypothetical protein [Acidimicrobiales bacterium]